MTGEYLTTQMCHKCGDLTEAAANQEGNGVSRDLRCCRGACTEGYPNNRRVLNRDRNAAINIYKAGMAYIKGEERPIYLTKAGKEEYLVYVALAAARQPVYFFVDDIEPFHYIGLSQNIQLGGGPDDLSTLVAMCCAKFNYLHKPALFLTSNKTGHF